MEYVLQQRILNQRFSNTTHYSGENGISITTPVENFVFALFIMVVAQGREVSNLEFPRRGSSQDEKEEKNNFNFEGNRRLSSSAVS